MGTEVRRCCTGQGVISIDLELVSIVDMSDQDCTDKA